MRPGISVLTRILSAASSTDSVLASDVTPDRSTFDKARYGTGSFTEDDVPIRIEPPPRVRIDGTTSRTVRITLMSRRSNAACQAASSNPSAVPAGGPPVFANSRSTPPNSFTVVACHCVECQRRTGSVFGDGAYYPNEQLSMSAASQFYSRPTDAGHQFTKHFCPRCGKSLHWVSGKNPGLVGIAVGAFADASVGAFLGSFFAAMLIFSVPITLLGMASPFAIRLGVVSVERAGEVAGRMYALSTAGSILGTFGAAILFIPAVGTQRTMIGTAVLLALATGVLIGSPWEALSVEFAEMISVAAGAVKSAEGVIFDAGSR